MQNGASACCGRQQAERLRVMPDFGQHGAIRARRLVAPLRPGEDGGHEDHRRRAGHPRLVRHARGQRARRQPAPRHGPGDATRLRSDRRPAPGRRRAGPRRRPRPRAGRRRTATVFNGIQPKPSTSTHACTPQVRPSSVDSVSSGSAPRPRRRHDRRARSVVASSESSDGGGRTQTSAGGASARLDTAIGGGASRARFRSAALAMRRGLKRTSRVASWKKPATGFQAPHRAAAASRGSGCASRDTSSRPRRTSARSSGCSVALGRARQRGASARATERQAAAASRTATTAGAATVRVPRANWCRTRPSGCQ